MQTEILTFLQNPVKANKYLLKYDDFIMPDFLGKMRELFVDFEEYRYYPKNITDLQAMCAEILSGNIFASQKICYIYFDDYTDLMKSFLEKLIRLSDENIVLVLAYTKDNVKLSKVEGVMRIAPIDLEKQFNKWAMMKINISGLVFSKEAIDYLLANVDNVVDVIQCLEKLNKENLTGSVENIKSVLENLDISHFTKKLINYLIKKDGKMAKKDDILLELKRQNVSISTLIWYFLNEIKRNSSLYPDYLEKKKDLYELNLESRLYDEDYVFLRLRILVSSMI